MQRVHARRRLRYRFKHTSALESFLRVFNLRVYSRKRGLAKATGGVASVAPVYLRYVAVAQIGIAIYKAKNNIGSVYIYPNTVGN